MFPLKSRVLISIVVAGLLSLSACSPGRKLSGGVATGTSEKKPEIETEKAAPAVTPAPQTTPVSMPVPSPIPASLPVPEIPKEVVPDDVVDGQEVFKDCKICFARATELAASIGFKANMLLTKNMGFYKISPAKNLCDVHFKKNLFDPIQDHEGKDSILDDQIALYCHCDCGWGK
jgi:hypothetical protein